MKCNVYINDIPIEEAPKELIEKLREKVKKAFKEHLGLHIIDDEE